ncbi:cleft lip and palate transmembrane protein 1-domain-containing protein [Dipodascopsis uninucleata]
MPAEANQAQAEEQGGRFSLKTIILLIILGNFLMGQFGPKTPSKPPPTPGEGPAIGEGDQPVSKAVVPINVHPLWPVGTEYDVRFYLSDSQIFDDFSSQPLLEEYGLKFGDNDYKLSKSLDYPTTSALRNNGSLYAHIYVAKNGEEFVPTSPKFNPMNSYSSHIRLSHYLPRKKEVKTKHLLGKDQDEELEHEIPSGPVSVVSYWHPNVTIGIVKSGQMSYLNAPEPIREWIPLESTGMRDATGEDGWFYPILFYNQFWQLASQMTEINSTTRYLPMSIEFVPMNFWKFQMMASMDHGFKQQSQSLGGSGELDEFKRVLLETNIYLLGITATVSILHMLFEMLAFKNDISHWKNKESQVGVSVRSIIANVVMQVIIFLYLVDNNENTSWMVLFTQGSGILVEAWKITKVIKINTVPSDGLIPYKIIIEDKHTLSETEKQTQEYDRIAFKYMYIAAVPLLGAYAIYSLIYDTHKSWYSFIITTLVGSVYAYGFLMLVPSIYINYRLKSVAHMPRRAMIYKFLNTFIDDLFAFVIKMPILHRLATLRDDVIFFIYLYQTWLYRVDPTRVNEFGQVGADEDEMKAEKEIEPESSESMTDEATTTGSSTAAERADSNSETRSRKQK